MNRERISDQHATKSLRNMLLKAGYSEKAAAYYLEQPNMGVLENADQVTDMTGTCGDTMRIYLKVDDGLIADARYEVFGCAGAVSAAMAAVDLVRGQSIEAAKQIDDGDVFNALVEIPVEKHHCIQLAVKTLHQALKDYNGNELT